MTDNPLPQPANHGPSNPPPPLPAAPATVFDPHLFPPRNRPLRQLIMDHNPFLLLSTVCMLLGCHLVNSALQKFETHNVQLMVLIATMNLYEACIIPLGLVLIRRTRGAARDGWWLILFETLFLVNAVFIFPDIHQWWAIPVNLGMFVLAFFKGAAVMYGLKIQLRLRTFGFFVLQLAMIYGLPIFFILLNDDGRTPPKIMYGLWWLVALLPVAYDQIARFDRRPQQFDLVQQVIRRVYLITPWVMLVVHMGFSHWVHNSRFQMADIGPVLFGLTIAARRVNWGTNMRFFVRALPALALLLTLLAPAEQLRWIIDIGGDTHQVLPVHFAIAATMLTYGYMGSLFTFLCCCTATWLLALGYIFQGWIAHTCRQIIRFCIDLLPNTAFSAGITAIVAAFVLLGMGSILSLRRTALPAVTDKTGKT